MQHVTLCNVLHINSDITCNITWIREIILNGKENKEITFEWSLGRASNIEVEPLVFFQRLKLLDASYIGSLIVFWNLALAFKLMHRTSSPMLTNSQELLGKYK